MYHMPRLLPNISICGRLENDCIQKLRDEIHVGSNSSFKCVCPYGCHDIKFEMELSSTPIFECAPQIKKSGLSAGNASILQGIFYLCLTLNAIIAIFNITFYHSQIKCIIREVTIDLKIKKVFLIEKKLRAIFQFLIFFQN